MHFGVRRPRLGHAAGRHTSGTECLPEVSRGRGSRTVAVAGKGVGDPHARWAMMRSGFSLTSLVKNSVIANPGVQDGVDQVDEQIDHHHPGGEEQVDSGDHRVVSVIEGIHHETPEPILFCSSKVVAARPAS